MRPLLKAQDFYPVWLTSNSIDEAWFKLLVELTKVFRVQEINTGSFEKDSIRLEFDWAGGVILNPIRYTDSGIRLPLAPTVPQGCPPPTTDADIEKYFLEKLMNGNPAPNEHYSYGWYLRGLKQGPSWLQEAHFEYDTHGFVFERKPFDQVQWIIDYLNKTGLFTNHACMQIGFPQNLLVYDWPYKDETDRGTTPCLRIVDLKVISSNGQNFLVMYVYFRSWDLMYGFPENLGGLSLLLEYIAGMLNPVVYPGALVFMSKGLHCYKHAIDVLEMRSGKSIKQILEEKYCGQKNAFNS
jgi:hypothetical protein